MAAGQRVCMHCHSSLLTKYQRDSVDLYRCGNCAQENPRAMYVSGIQIEWLSEWEPKHHSVGALVEDADRFLIIKRRVFPYKHGVPAGHVDAFEDPRMAIQREVEEELGVTPDEVHEIAHESHLVGDRCRKGADVHEWTLFRCFVDNARITNNSDEASNVLWVTPEEASRLEFGFASGHMLRLVGKLQ